MTPSYTYPEAMPALGTVGDRAATTSQFDGWGTSTSSTRPRWKTSTANAIPEAMDPDYAFGFGDLSVHDVATDPTDPWRT